MNLINQEQKVTPKNGALAQVRPNSLHKKIFLVVFVMLWGTGGIWLILNILGYRPVPKMVIELHGAFAMLFLVMLGSIWEHIRRAWNMPAIRVSGIIIVALCTAMIITAWMLYYVGNDTSRNVAGLVHSICGVVVLFILGKHLA